MKRFGTVLLLLFFGVAPATRLGAQSRNGDPRDRGYRDTRYDSHDLQITRAVYGVGKRVMDVTGRLNSQIRGGELHVQVMNQTMGGDPARNKVKTLTVWYTLDGRAAQVAVNENAYLDLPVEAGYDQALVERVVIPAGAEVDVMTNQRIDSRDVVEGQTFSAQIAQDVRGTDGSIAIPRGSDASLITRRLEGNGDITLDVASIVVAGRRYRISTEDQELQGRPGGIGANQRTGEFVGGGAAIGAIIGAILDGGKGAAIGAAAGAGAGAGTQIVTQGREVHVPAESVIRFRLDRPLRLRFWQ